MSWPMRLDMLREEAQLSQEQVGERTGANRYMVRFW
jgi:transcriptional regulator with XRE-family HTH domain